MARHALFLIVLCIPVGAATCDNLASLKLARTTITAAKVVASGEFRPPGSALDAEALARYQTLPAFCRVQGVIQASGDSKIEFELWLPTEKWNGRFLGVGNGGWAGFINYGGLFGALRQGYATASTDTGHTGASAEFAVGHPEKLIDFAYRGVHEMALQSKSIVAAFFGRPSQYSYWNGCSAGGGQGVMEAWRYPNDFDGILAGSSGNPLTMDAEYWWMWVAQAVHSTPDSFIPPEKYSIIHAAALEACDAADGLRDGLIQDPTLCRFDPAILLCRDSGGRDCLTQAQVEAARRLYSPARDSRTGKLIYPGLQPGSELGWGSLAGETPPSYATEIFRHLVFKDPKWDFRSIPFDSLIAVPTGIPASFSPMNPDLKAFFQRRGKLLLYHGWNDTVNAPGSSVAYYRSVLKTVGNEAMTQDSIRLFMAPGMGHCRGGEGPNTFDGMTPLRAWVERGEAPTSIIASHSTAGKSDRTRPLCPYPELATYKGSGSIDDASNFVCRVP